MIWPRLFPLNRLKRQKEKKKKKKKEDNNNKGKYYMDAWKVEKLTNLIILKKIFVFPKYIYFGVFSKNKIIKRKEKNTDMIY